MIQSRILIVDDESSIRSLLGQALEKEGYSVSVASSAEDAEKVFGAGSGFAVVVTDLKMPGKDGFYVLKSVRAKNPLTRVMVITGHGDKAAAIEAVRAGACDYLEKPFEMPTFLKAVTQAVHQYQRAFNEADRTAALEAKLDFIYSKDKNSEMFEPTSKSMAQVTQWLGVLKRESQQTLAEEPCVLITGESGTGKEGIARSIHSNSRRKDQTLVSINCANLSESLLESELFGHEKGAFTGAQSMKRGLFEIAKGGTLFLDEIGEMDAKLQAKLLRTLQEKKIRRVGGTLDIPVDVRVIAATNAALDKLILAGKFREDLYHRINRVVIALPALRDRKEDLLPMARFFATKAFKSRHKKFDGFTAESEMALKEYAWPGNVRELENVIERAALIHSGNGPVSAQVLGISNRTSATVIKPSFKVVDGGKTSPGDNGGGGGGGGLPLPTGPDTEAILADTGSVRSYMDLKKQWVDAFEKEYLTQILKKYDGNVSAAAREAALDRSNFLRLLRRHSIKASAFRGEDQQRTGEAQEAADNVVQMPMRKVA